jgi:hypothetical protein
MIPVGRVTGIDIVCLVSKNSSGGGISLGVYLATTWEHILTFLYQTFDRGISEM